MAAPKAPLLDVAGKKAKDVTLDEAVFGAEVKPHLLHETVRAEGAAARSGTASAKTRSQVSGGGSKPWRQKGTGRARAGSSRISQWTGGGVAFPPIPRSYELKVNRKARKVALRGALSHHAERKSLAVIDGSKFDAPSTKAAVACLAAWGVERPTLVVCRPGEETMAKSFRNVARVRVVEPSELEVTALLWARSLLVSESALEHLQGGDRR